MSNLPQTAYSVLHFALQVPQLEKENMTLLPAPQTLFVILCRAVHVDMPRT